MRKRVPVPDGTVGGRFGWPGGSVDEDSDNRESNVRHSERTTTIPIRYATVYDLHNIVLAELALNNVAKAEQNTTINHTEKRLFRKHEHRAISFGYLLSGVSYRSEMRAWPPSYTTRLSLLCKNIHRFSIELFSARPEECIMLHWLNASADSIRNKINHWAVASRRLPPGSSNFR